MASPELWYLGTTLLLLGIFINTLRIIHALETDRQCLKK